MLKKIIKLFLIYCRLYKKPVCVNNNIYCCGRIFGRLSRFAFDQRFYLECYDDVRQNGIDPVEHYYYYGRSEGRVGVPVLPIIDLNKIDKARSTVLLVTHELSPTGAPILAYNIAKELCKKYNVLIISLGEGSLYDEFSKLGVALFCEPSLRYSEPISKFFIGKLNEKISINFAVVNSIESTAVLPGLYQINIPVVSMLHEFASYSGGLDRFRRCIYWSTLVLLSSEIAKNDLLKTGQISDTEKLSVLPQGKCIVPTYNKEDRAVLPLAKSNEVIRVIGAGTITYRKGVDLFIECARAIRNGISHKRLEFIWIGKNVDSALGTDYFQYLNDQVNRSGLKSCFNFIGEADSYEEILSTADIFLMTSRLDPLPNVAIDAFAKSLPVFFFRDASGLSSLILKTNLESRLCADYLSPSNMAAKVVQYIQDEGKVETLAGIRKFYEENFRFDNYFDKLEIYFKEAVDSHERMQQEADFLRSHSGINEYFCHPKIWTLFGKEDFTKRYVNMWKSNIYKYKPTPDFHPGIYRSMVNPTTDPYVHYIKSGRPSGPWKSDLVNLAQVTSETSSELTVAIHIHCYYPELLEDILSRLAGNNSKVDIYVSTNTVAKKDAIASIFAKRNLVPCSVDVTPNIGRDIGPFLNVYCSDLSDRYDVIFHVHTKKSPHVNENDGKNWYEYCLENLLGGIGGNVLDKILAEFSDKSLGLVYPSDPNAIGWGDNFRYSENVLGRLGLAAKKGDFNFPVGTMFAASKRLVRRLCDLDFHWDEYPCEPLPIDGTMLHAVERSIPYIAEDLGLRQMLVYVNKTTRV
jgi:glycosyltransferase involved in cell wall biosynthesis